MKKWGGQLDIRPPNLKIGGIHVPPHPPPPPPRIDAPATCNAIISSYIIKASLYTTNHRGRAINMAKYNERAKYANILRFTAHFLVFRYVSLAMYIFK